MIAAGLVLLTIGLVDLAREFLPKGRRWVGLLVVAILIVAIGALSDGLLASVAAIVVAAVWVWLTPGDDTSRAGFWPVVGVAALCAALTATVPARPGAGVIGAYWRFPTPLGDLSFDHVVLLTGAVVFLLESANVVVRAALDQEHVQVADISTDAPAPGQSTVTAEEPAVEASAPSLKAVPDASPPTPAASDGADAATTPTVTASVPGPALKGGRLIGPLERLLVFALTLAAMYPLLAAILAAKGIVRFPEISRDSAAGNRAEYFLIGSLVSWVLALAAAFLVWWAFATP